MINSFKNFLVEETKIVYFTFGRMNPPTIGHEKLLTNIATKAGSNPYRIFLSPTQDNKKNPLQYKDKIKFVRKMFPKYARSVVMNPKIRTPLEAAVSLYNEGYRSIAVVVGSDRVREFEVLLSKYNGAKARHGFYNFESIKVISAGARDPDAEGVEGMSASKMRAAASSGDFTSFSQGTPTSASNAETKALYNAIRKGMGLKEENKFRNHIDLIPVSETREQYVKGNLVDIGDDVVIKEDSSIATISFLGSNYVIVEQNGVKFRKWLTDIEVLDTIVKEQSSPQDPDIKDRKGSQPAAYHRGLAKSTKAKRDAHFKKHGKKADNDPSAYKPAPGDKGAKTKPSKYTKAFKDMYGEQTIDTVRDRISREKEVEKRRDAADKKRHDSMMDRARAAHTRKINRRTNKV